MHGSQLDPMVDDLQALDRIGKPILTAWNANGRGRECLNPAQLRRAVRGRAGGWAICPGIG
jgi:hypothetical protein